MSQNSESHKPMNMQGLVDAAEMRTACIHGVKRPVARAALARAWGVSVWTLENFRRGRLKDLRCATRDRIQAGIVRGIESEIQRLEHELDLVRHRSAGLSETDLSAASAALEEARRFIKGD